MEGENTKDSRGQTLEKGKEGYGTQNKKINVLIAENL